MARCAARPVGGVVRTLQLRNRCCTFYAFLFMLFVCVVFDISLLIARLFVFLLCFTCCVLCVISQLESLVRAYVHQGSPQAFIAGMLMRVRVCVGVRCSVSAGFLSISRFLFLVVLTRVVRCSARSAVAEVMARAKAAAAISGDAHNMLRLENVPFVFTLLFCVCFRCDVRFTHLFYSVCCVCLLGSSSFV